MACKSIMSCSLSMTTARMAQGRWFKSIILLNHRPCAIRAVVIDNEQLIIDLHAIEIQTNAIQQRSNVCFFVQRRYDQAKFVAHGFFLPACRQLRQPSGSWMAVAHQTLYEKYLMRSAVVERVG